MKILKNNRYVFSAFLLIFIVNVGLATNGQEHKTSNQEQQEGRRKSDQTIIHPDGDYNSPGQGQQEFQQQESEPQQEGASSSVSEPRKRTQIKSDSLEDDSVSKYNFIFYFLYKFKYESEESP